MYLSIIIPAHNEEKRIAKTLIKIDQYLSQKNFSYEIIVVNDGSKDKTVEVVEKLKTKIINLGIINNEKNYGKGHAVRQGLTNARGEYRLFTDADNSTNIEEFNKFLPYLSCSDIIFGSRVMKGSKIIIPQPFYRLFLGNIFRLITQIFIGLWNISDTQCGFKLLNSKAVKDILPRCKINGWSFDAEILIIAKKLNYKLKEIPIIWKNDRKSKVKLKGMFIAIIDLLKIKWHLITNKYNI
jgi:dolichyl-phosphate beta-glucosyltransferase